MSRRTHWVVLAVLAVLAAGAGPVAGEAPGKPDPPLRREPAYQAARQEYFVLAFGPDARAWVVRDGDDLYVDRDGDGDLTGEGERVSFKHSALQPVRLAIGKRRASLQGIQQTGTDNWYFRVELDERLLQYGTVQPAARPEKATVLCFGGPLTMSLSHSDPAKQPLKRGSRPYDFGVMVTTAGPARPEVWGPVIDHKEHVPADVHPVAEFEFAPKAAGAAPVKLRAVLDRRC
jgi:hypothetical protein